MLSPTNILRPFDAPASLAEQTFARMGSLGVIAAGLMALVVFAL
ncbi:hypothetical protein OJF2_04480 [Aquisphaera giovannonii]|uniref:Uncharacterized protein n=1 Tax=Aquisphaera giovannonii TaxID=406548 RepID=A0A5B9VVU7_9BACT|nr:hypothetical protein [Aquisphaera giovannonii]QEH31981.1 hypothetical protein OJF2_04480 [Aquisphaera giovannonii]